MIHANTDRLMDVCHCGAHAGFELQELGGKLKYRAGCSECCERGPAFEEHWGLAVIDWNLMQRKLKGIIKDEPRERFVFTKPKRCTARRAHTAK